MPISRTVGLPKDVRAAGIAGASMLYGARFTTAGAIYELRAQGYGGDLECSPVLAVTTWATPGCSTPPEPDFRLI